MPDNEKDEVKKDAEPERHGRFLPPKKAVRNTMPLGSVHEEAVHQAVTVARQSVPAPAMPAPPAMEVPDPFAAPVVHPRSSVMEDSLMAGGASAISSPALENALSELDRDLNRESPLPTSVREEDLVPVENIRPLPLPSNRDGETLAAPGPPSVSSPPAGYAAVPEPEREDAKMEETRKREEKHSAAIASPPEKAPKVIVTDPPAKTGPSTKSVESRKRSFLESASGALTNLFGKVRVLASGERKSSDETAPSAKERPSWHDKPLMVLYGAWMVIAVGLLAAVVAVPLVFMKTPVSGPPAPAIAVKAKWEPLTAEFIKKNSNQDWTEFKEANLPGTVYCADPESALDVTTGKWNLSKGKCKVLTQP